MESVPATFVKQYPPRGPLQQYRFATSTAFHCVRCGQSKKSKLITVYGGDWSKRLCNGCYGRLLSLYEIKSGTSPDDKRAEALSRILLTLVTEDERRQSEQILLASETCSNKLSSNALQFVTSSEFLAGKLPSEPHLEWSGAVIGLCKAVEMEIVQRIVFPLSELCDPSTLTNDLRDKDLSRVAAYCADSNRPTPELGAFSHFLKTAIHSKNRRESSRIIRTFFSLISNWHGSQWILDPSQGLHSSIVQLTRDFRNRAAHIDELDSNDYQMCRSLVIGTNGLLWHLHTAVETHR